MRTKRKKQDRDKTITVDQSHETKGVDSKCWHLFAFAENQQNSKNHKCSLKIKTCKYKILPEIKFYPLVITPINTILKRKWYHFVLSAGTKLGRF